MAIAFLTGAGGNGTGTSSVGPHTVARGALTDGCVAVVIVSWMSATTITAGSALTTQGFTQDGATRTDGTTGLVDIYWKHIVTAGSEAAWTFSFAAAARTATAMACYSGVNTTSPLDPSTFTWTPEAAAANTSRETGNAVTTLSGTWLLWGAFDRLTTAGTAGDHTDGSGTRRAMGTIATGTNAAHCSLFDSNGSVAASTYSKTITSNLSTTIAGGFIGGLKEAAAAASKPRSIYAPSRAALIRASSR